MSREAKCSIHDTKAEFLCLYHREPICVGCKYDDRHKLCPFEKDLVPLTADIPPSDQDREKLFGVCKKVYGDVLDLRNKDFSQQCELNNKLNVLFGTFKSRITVLQTESEKCVDKTKSICKQQFDNVQQNCKKVLSDIGQEMKELFVNPQDLSKIDKNITLFREIVDRQAKEMRGCDQTLQLVLRLARVFDHDKVVTLREEILTSKFIESLFPPVLNPEFEFVMVLNTSMGSRGVKKPFITGCTVLLTGEIVLVDNNNSTVILYTASGNFAS